MSIRRAASVVLALLGPVLSGCADLHLTQPEGYALARIGPTLLPYAKVSDYIGNYTPYAILAATAYQDIDAQGRLVGAPEFVSTDGKSWRAEAQAWLKPWRFEFGAMGPLCEGAGCGLPGLEYQVWTRRAGAHCDEAAIVFRGTDANSLGDWLSDLHGVTRLLPINDQYEQVQAKMRDIVDRVRKLRCVSPGTRIVTVGHSLGGGLAQQAAYMSEHIHRVYAFDPSPVTGWTDMHTRYPAKPWPLVIERVYEHGEVLAYVRFVLRQLIPPTDCDPRIRSFRVDLIHGQPFFQHSMATLAAGFMEKSGAPYDPKYARPLPGSSPNEGLACRGRTEIAAGR